jgi:hypothetical protein
MLRNKTGPWWIWSSWSGDLPPENPQPGAGKVIVVNEQTYPDSFPDTKPHVELILFDAWKDGRARSIIGR